MPKYSAGPETIYITKETEDWVVEVVVGDHSQHWYFSRADFTLADVLTEIKNDFPDMKEG
jgi:hypothetical protein